MSDKIVIPWPFKEYKRCISYISAQRSALPYSLRNLSEAPLKVTVYTITSKQRNFIYQVDNLVANFTKWSDYIVLAVQWTPTITKLLHESFEAHCLKIVIVY